MLVLGRTGKFRRNKARETSHALIRNEAATATSTHFYLGSLALRMRRFDEALLQTGVWVRVEGPLPGDLASAPALVSNTPLTGLCDWHHRPQDNPG